MTKEELAATATSLIENEAFQAAMIVMRSDALEELARVDPTDADAIRAHQANVKAVDSFEHRLRVFIAEGKPRQPPGIA